MRKLLLMLMIFVTFIIPAHVSSQGEVHLSLLNVDIWPEYDQQAVLMIYRLTLASDTRLPASLALHLPANGQINAVAVIDPTQGLVNTPYEKTIQGQSSVLTITTNSLQVQVEFYEPLVKDGINRHIQFEWAGDYAVEKLDANFLKPSGAVNVSISVAPTDTGPGQDGLTNYHIQKVNLAAGKSFSLTIDYQRQTDDLSISSLPVVAASTPGPDTAGRSSMAANLPWILAGIGVLLIVVGMVWFVVWQQGGKSLKKGKKNPSQREKREDESIYCYKCGKRAQPGDVFCRTCGTRLKRGSTN